MGGLAPFSTGVPNGRGGFMGSGTNAPLYTTPFSVARQKTQEDMENHESRLAEALEIDRSTRVLEFRDPSMSPPQPVTSDRKKKSETEHKTVWNGTEWVMSSLDRSKICVFPPYPTTSQPDVLQRPLSHRSAVLSQWRPSSKSFYAMESTY